MPTEVLIVEDENTQREMLAGLLTSHGHDVVEADSVRSACKAIDARPPDFLLTDFNLPDGDGLEVLNHVRAKSPHLPAVLLSAYGTVAIAVDAMRLGAFDVLMKPIGPDVLMDTVRRAMEAALDKGRPAGAKAASIQDGEIAGTSDAIREALELAGRLSRTDAPILITGESGTGKELFARFIHERGAGEQRPFVAVNCGAVPPGLIESEFFGHVKGAFTGATDDRAGCFEQAGRGTLFLDEIGELPIGLQGRLLRALQEQEVVRVGESRPRPVHARVLTATNRDLAAEVRAGTFRADLFHRIHVLRLHLPPLRERGKDALQLAQLFLAEAAAELGVEQLRLHPIAEDAITNYAFPGNVRELRNMMSHAAVLSSDGLVRVGDLPAAVLALTSEGVRVTAKSLDLKKALSEVEERLIRAALQRTKGVQVRAARLLGIDERVLRYRRSKLGIERDGA